MPEPAFIVEGHMEQIIIRRLCPKKPVQRLEVNGDDVRIEAIVDRLETFYRILNNKYYPIIVFFDREGRAESCEQICANICAELERRGVDSKQFNLGICDRMIENWILADADLIRAEFGKSPPAETEGSNGKAVLTKLCKNGGVSYHESTVGADLFSRLRPNIVYNLSPSFRAFINQLNIDCWWTKDCRDLAAANANP